MRNSKNKTGKMEIMKLKKNALFNPAGDTETRLRRMIGGNTTNLNDFNNVRYKWVSDWYRQAMNNFWIPEEINQPDDHCQCHNKDQAHPDLSSGILHLTHPFHPSFMS